MPNTLWLWVVRTLSSQGILSQRLRGGLLSNDNSRTLTLSSQPFMVVGGGLFIATRQPDLICPKWPLVTKELTRVPTVRFQTHTTTLLGLQAKLTYPTLTIFALIVFTRRHRILVKHHFSHSDWFSWTPLNSTVVPMTQQRKTQNNETTKSSRSIVFTRCPLLS